MSNVFRFKQFEVANELSAMKVGTDGVLLGAWAGLDATVRRILDVGTGTGVIALMMAQRTSGDCAIAGKDAPERQPCASETVKTCRSLCPEGVSCRASQPVMIDAIDIDGPSVREAKGNFEASPWAARLSATLSSFQNYDGGCKYDLIISNPPFFVNSLKASDARRSDARHTDTLSYEDIVLSSLRLLSPKGRLALVLPAVEADDFVLIAGNSGLTLTRLCIVSTKPGAAPGRHLMEFSKTADAANKDIPDARKDILPTRSSLPAIPLETDIVEDCNLFHNGGKTFPITEHLIIQDSVDFTPEYKALTRDFYLKF